MPKRPLRHRAEDILGRIIFTETCRPVAYEPPKGVRYRIRSMREVERLYKQGLISSDDLLKARRYDGAM